MTVEGQAKGQFREVVLSKPIYGDYQELEIDQRFDGDLYISAVSGCLGLVGLSQPVWYQATYQVQSPSGLFNLRP